MQYFELTRNIPTLYSYALIDVKTIEACMQTIALLCLDVVAMNVTCPKLINYWTIVFNIVQVVLLAILNASSQLMLRSS